MNSFLQRFLSRKQADAPAAPVASTPAPAPVSPAPMPSTPAVPAQPAAMMDSKSATVAEPEVFTTPDSSPTPTPVMPVETTTEPEVTPAPAPVASSAPAPMTTSPLGSSSAMGSSSSAMPSSSSMGSAEPAPVKSADSYVDSYTPPAASAAPVMPAPVATPAPSAAPSAEPAPVKADAPAEMKPAAPAAQSEVSSSAQSERLEDQNIFVLLGIQNEPEAEKEAFLDELQQVIWEDFLNHDVELLLTEEEMKEFRTLSDQPSASEEERQGKLVEYLEKLIPDLERIMLDKALELKEEMVRERLKEMMEQMGSDAAKKSKLEEVQSHFDQEKWFTGAQTLNSLE